MNPKMGKCCQNKIIRAAHFGRVSPCPTDFGGTEIRRQLTRYMRSNSILKVKEVIEIIVEPLRPASMPVPAIYQLDRDPHPIA